MELESIFNLVEITQRNGNYKVSKDSKGKIQQLYTKKDKLAFVDKTINELLE